MITTIFKKITGLTLIIANQTRINANNICDRLRLQLNSLSGQTAAELAIFGAILVMVIGVLVSYSLTFNYTHSYQLRTFRWALDMSHQIDRVNPNGEPALNRRTSSIVVTDDRQMPDLSNPFGIMPRSPTGGSASASFNRHLYASPSYGILQDLPVVDFYINGWHFYFTTANFKYFDCSTITMARTKVVIGTDEFNDPGMCEFPNDNSNLWWKRCSVYCDIHVWKDDGYAYPTPSIDIDSDHKDEAVLDYRALASDWSDSDRYLKEECNRDPENGDRECLVTGLFLIDYQEGEMDLTIDDYDLRSGTGIQQGLLVKGTAESKVKPGTLFRKREDSVSHVTLGQIETTTTVKKEDIITRIIQLNPNHTGGWDNVIGQTEGGNTVGDCEGANKNKTCFEPESAKFYVRSNLKVDRTVKWQTPK